MRRSFDGIRRSDDFFKFHISVNIKERHSLNTIDQQLQTSFSKKYAGRNVLLLPFNERSINCFKSKHILKNNRMQRSYLRNNEIVFKKVGGISYEQQVKTLKKQWSSLECGWSKYKRRLIFLSLKENMSKVNNRGMKKYSCDSSININPRRKLVKRMSRDFSCFNIESLQHKKPPPKNNYLP